MFFRNYTYLQLSHFAFENKIPMIVFRVFTHTGQAWNLVCWHCFTFWFCIQRELKQKIGESGGLRGVCHPLYWRGSLRNPPPLITKKVRGHWLACLRKPCFQTFKEGNGGRGRSLAKKNKNQQSIWKNLYLFFFFKQLNYCTLNPNILSMARKHPGATSGGFTLDPSGEKQKNKKTNKPHFIPRTRRRGTVWRRALKIGLNRLTQQSRLICSFGHTRSSPASVLHEHETKCLTPGAPTTRTGCPLFYFFFSSKPQWEQRLPHCRLGLFITVFSVGSCTKAPWDSLHKDYQFRFLFFFFPTRVDTWISALLRSTRTAAY